MCKSKHVPTCTQEEPQRAYSAHFVEDTWCFSENRPEKPVWVRIRVLFSINWKSEKVMTLLINEVIYCGTYIASKNNNWHKTGQQHRDERKGMCEHNTLYFIFSLLCVINVCIWMCAVVSNCQHCQSHSCCLITHLIIQYIRYVILSNFFCLCERTNNQPFKWKVDCTTKWSRQKDWDCGFSCNNSF